MQQLFTEMIREMRTIIKIMVIIKEMNTKMKPTLLFGLILSAVAIFFMASNQGALSGFYTYIFPPKYNILFYTFL